MFVSMSTVLSIDVGIKNLSFCLLRVTGEVEILKWDTINLNEPFPSSGSTKTQHQPYVCTTKPGCKLKPCYAYRSTTAGTAGTQYTCKRHYKSTPDVALRRVFDEKPTHISKIMKTFTMEKLRDFCTTCGGINIPDEIKSKPELRAKALEVLKSRYVYPIEIYDKCFCIIETPESTEPPIINADKNINKTSSASTVSLVFVGYNLMKRFDDLFYTNSDTHIDTVVIENQISPIANRMKTVQGMITQYFLMRGVDKNNIIYYSSVQKLKVAPYHFVFHMETDSEISDNVDDIQTYDERKKAGVACVRKILSCSNMTKISSTSLSESSLSPKSPKLFAILPGSWLERFEKHSKKDDMADSFLQGLSYLIKTHQTQKNTKI